MRKRARSAAFAAATALTLGYVGCGSDDPGNSTFGSGGSSAASGSGGGTAADSGILFGGSGGGTGATGGSGGNAGDACASTVVGSSLVHANLLFVVDRSGSMNCNLPTDGQSTAECEQSPVPKFPSQPTKWELTRDALKQALDDIQAGGNASVGMVSFPISGSECIPTESPDVGVLPMDATQNAALKGFLDGISPKGQTPLVGATILSYKHLYEQLKTGALDGNLFVVVITDGFETCKPSAISGLLTQDIPNARSVNIRTFVIGVPGSEDGRALLSEIAYQGGTPTSSSCTHDPSPPGPADVGDCHFDMTTSTNLSQDLQAALAVISGTALSCEIDMPGVKPGQKIDYDSVKVKNNGADIPKDDSTPCDQGADGWQFDASKSKILLCGSACDDAKKPGTTLSIDLGCLSNIR